MDYYAIGQRIRKYRKAIDMSQEQLAYAVDISTTHMSHIETGNTKLSLPVLVKIAKALSVHTDALIYDKPQMRKTDIAMQIQEVLEPCTAKELNMILDIVKAVKQTFREYEEEQPLL